MATITENREALKQAKTAIKTAIEGKLGENALANVPFTQYADKISEIESGGGGGTNFFTSVWLPQKSSLSYMFQGYGTMTDAELATAGISKENTKKVTDVQYMFKDCKALTTLPEMDLGNCTTMSNFVNGCGNLIRVPLYDTTKVTNLASCFWVCNSLEEIPAWDMRSCTNFGSAFNMTGLKRIWIRNIGASISFYGAATVMLEDDCLLHLARECRNMGKSLTLGLRASEKTYFDNTYVRVLDDSEITTDMVKEDENIDLLKSKVPFVKCKSGDAGAMTLKEYMSTKKGWSV